MASKQISEEKLAANVCNWPRKWHRMEARIDIDKLTPRPYLPVTATVRQ